MEYPSGYKYTKEHEWIDVTGDRGRVGITDYAQQQLGDVVLIELPEVGTALKEGQSFGTIESVKAVSELYLAGIGRGGRGQRRAQEQARVCERGSARQLVDRRQAVGAERSRRAARRRSGTAAS